MKQLTVFAITLIFIITISITGQAQTAPQGNDVNTPLHLLQPEYPVQYGVPVKDSIRKILDRVYNYLDAVTPAQLINKKTNEHVTDYSKACYLYILYCTRCQQGLDRWHCLRPGGWAAVSAKVNDRGQVEGTCVGTGMGFDPAFYYYRPVNIYAAHGYGPVLLAGAEMIQLLKKNKFRINDSALQYYSEK